MHAVLNWLWQGCVVAVALFAMLKLIDRARANVRYALCWAAQLLVLALPVVAWLQWGAAQPGPLPRVPVDAVSVPDVWWTSGLAMMAAWTVWASVGAIRFVRALLVIRRARAQSRPFPGTVAAALAQWQRVRRSGRRATIVVSDRVSAAAVLGCGAPVIAVAPSLIAALDADELDRVVVHEWAHVQRRDDLVNLLQIPVRIVAGWHPAVWWIDRRLQAEREVACDETTVAITGAPKSYAACLVKLAGLRGATRPALAAPAVLPAAGLRARITRIVSRDAFLAPRYALGLATGIAAMLAVVTGAVAQTRLVAPAGLAFPYESIRAAALRVEGLAPAAPPSMPPSPQHAAPAVDSRTATAAPAASVRDVAPVAPSPEASEVESQLPAGAPLAVELPEPAAAAPGPEPATVAATSRPQAGTLVNPVDPARVPWETAADGGKTIGKKSKEAGVATAGAFSKFARRIAGSF